MKKKKDKIGSLRFKVSFMRGKFFEPTELSNVLQTKQEKLRKIQEENSHKKVEGYSKNLL